MLSSFSPHILLTFQYLPGQLSGFRCLGTLPMRQPWCLWRCSRQLLPFSCTTCNRCSYLASLQVDLRWWAWNTGLLGKCPWLQVIKICGFMWFLHMLIHKSCSFNMPHIECRLFSVRTVGQTLSQRFVDWVGSPSCSVSSWESEKDNTLNNNDVFWEQYGGIEPIEIRENYINSCQRTPSFSKKSCFQVLQPDEAPLLMEYLTKLLEQLVDFIRVFEIVFNWFCCFFCRWRFNFSRWILWRLPWCRAAYCFLNFKDVILQCLKRGVVQVHGGYAEPSTDSGYFP